MSDTQSRTPLGLFGLLFTLIALLALLALVFVRSHAENVTTLNQSTTTASVPMTVDSATLTQGGSDVTFTSPETQSTHPINLTAGGQSDPITLTVHFTSNNGVANTVLQPNAHVILLARLGAVAPSQTLCDGADGTTCWTQTYTGTTPGSTTTDVVTVDPGYNGTKGTMTATVTLPYYAQKGAWSFWYDITMVDANGTEQAPAYAASNIFNNTPISATVNSMVAIDVSTAGGALATYTAIGGAGLTPNQVSDAVTITVTQKGSVREYASLVGQPWTSDAGAAALDVGITHFTGGSFAATDQATADASYVATTTEALTATFPPDANSQVMTGGVANSWTVPMSIGPQDSSTGVVVDGTNAFDTMIKIPSGSVGNYSSVLTVIASEAL